jgi:hypothetical protein
MRHLARLALPLVLLGACATAQVDLEEPRRVVGSEAGVRVNAEIRGEEISPGSPLAVTYEVSNERNVDIAIADLIPTTTWDADSRVLTLHVGSEVPGEQLLPRLLVLKAGEKRTFTTTARLAMVPPAPSADPRQPRGAELRIKVNFLADLAPFAALIGIPERAVNDPQLADQLFPLWIDRNEAVYTGTVPVRFGVARTAVPAPPR